MKKNIILSLAALLFTQISFPSSSGCSISFTSCSFSPWLNGVSFFSPRSQSVNAARELVGWWPYIHQYGKDSCYGVFCLAPEFTQSFRNARMAQALFGTDTISITGSLVANRAENDMLADYFGLSPAYESQVTFNPEIRNFILPFYGYIGFDRWVKGLYLQFQVPFVHTRWDLRPCETIFESGADIPFPAGYMAQEALTARNCSFVQALSAGFPYGQVDEPICNGLFGCLQTQNALSDVQIALGYDFVLREHGHAGLNLRFSVPTGTRPNGHYLFEPIVGNGKHWELGVGFTGQVLTWEKDGTQELWFLTNGNFTYMFNARQCRSFDFCCNGFGSRFILMKEFDETQNYIGSTIPAINRTTLSVDVSMNIQMDLVLMLGYKYRNFYFDIGYNAYLRSAEKIHLDCECQPDLSIYGLKGIQDVTFADGELSNATQSCATIYGNYFEDQNLVADPNSPVLLSACDINLNSAASPRILTQKFFAHLSGQFCMTDHIIPFLGVGGEIEFEGINRNNTCISNENTLSQWGVWVKGGASFH